MATSRPPTLFLWDQLTSGLNRSSSEVVSPFPSWQLSLQSLDFSLGHFYAVRTGA